LVLVFLPHAQEDDVGGFDVLEGKPQRPLQGFGRPAMAAGAEDFEGDAGLGHLADHPDHGQPVRSFKNFTRQPWLEAEHRSVKTTLIEVQIPAFVLHVIDDLVVMRT
jgi:hypothetical protein